MDGRADDNNNREQKRSATRISEKYGLRPRSVFRSFHLSRGRNKVSSQRGHTKSPKSRPPPLSKYRRKTANARERHRMKEINEAFESLRKILPNFCTRRAAASMTKITTLRLAVDYIQALSHVLEDGHPRDVSIFNGFQMDINLGGSRFNAMAGIKDCTDIQYQPEVQQESHGSRIMSSSTSNESTSWPSSPTTCSLSSPGDLCDLLSDDASVFEDDLGAFDNIPTLHDIDTFALLMAPDGDVLPLESQYPSVLLG